MREQVYRFFGYYHWTSKEEDDDIIIFDIIVFDIIIFGWGMGISFSHSVENAVECLFDL